MLKCVFLGDSSCGKTKLISAFVNDEFDEEYEPTISGINHSIILFHRIVMRVHLCACMFVPWVSALEMLLVLDDCL